MNDTLVEEQPGVPARVSAGRALFWATLAVGIATNAVEAYFAIGGLLDMAHGSCSAALIGLWFGLPLVPLGVVLFVLGAVVARRADPSAFTAGVIGLTLSLVAVPLWYFISFGAASILDLG